MTKTKALDEVVAGNLEVLGSAKRRGFAEQQRYSTNGTRLLDERACVIAEWFRVLKSGAPLFMVNDNVRYAGASVSVDMILSGIAEELGFCVENILVLPNGKGNSSQQIGVHGCEALRKCVYVWRKGSKDSSSARQLKIRWQTRFGANRKMVHSITSRT